MSDGEQAIEYGLTRGDLFAFGLSRAWRSRTAKLLHGVMMIGLAALGVHEATKRADPPVTAIIAALVFPGIYLAFQAC
jgi:hypothetical protein